MLQADSIASAAERAGRQVTQLDWVVGPVDLDALVEYVEGLPTPFTSQIEGRIVLTP